MKEIIAFKERKVKAKEIFTIKEIERNIGKEFVSKYHYLGDANYLSMFNFGLFIDDTLVGVATFGTPQGNVTLKSWFGLTDNSDRSIVECFRLCLLPDLNGSNATSYLLGKSIQLLKKKGVRAVITLADSERHVGSIYQVCNFKYYGLSKDKNDYYLYIDENTFKKGARGIKISETDGVWVKRSRKHRYAYILDDSLKCLYDEVERPKTTETFVNNCCNDTHKVWDRRNDQYYTCPICTGKLQKIKETD